MADNDVPITAGSGTNIHTFLNVNSFHDQYLRSAPATTVANPNSWPLSTTATTSLLAADTSRRWFILWNNSTSATVYLRYDTTAPTTAASGWHDQIPPGGRLEPGEQLACLPVSVIASAASGTMEYTTATSA